MNSILGYSVRHLLLWPGGAGPRSSSWGLYWCWSCLNQLSNEINAGDRKMYFFSVAGILNLTTVQGNRCGNCVRDGYERRLDSQTISRWLADNYGFKPLDH